METHPIVLIWASSTITSGFGAGAAGRNLGRRSLFGSLESILLFWAYTVATPEHRVQSMAPSTLSLSLSMSLDWFLLGCHRGQLGTLFLGLAGRLGLSLDQFPTEEQCKQQNKNMC